MNGFCAHYVRAKRVYKFATTQCFKTFHSTVRNVSKKL